MTLAEITSRRLEKVLNEDKKNTSPEITKMLESDLCTLLENYFALENLNVSISVENSKFVLNITSTATHLKNIGIMC